MIGFPKNDWVQRDIIYKIIRLPKQGIDTTHAVILTKYYKYPFTTIIKHAKVLPKANKWPCGKLQNILSHDVYSIPIHIHTVTLADISNEKKE